MTCTLCAWRGASRASYRREDGNVLLVAVLVAAIALSLTLVVTAVAIRAQRASGVDRQQGASISAAEAGIDSAYAAVQNSGATALPCSWPASGTPASMGRAPDQTRVLVSITYRNSAGVLPCAAGSSLAAGSAPVAASFSAAGSTQTIVGGSTAGRRVMESAVNLTPVRANGLDDALFADGTITVSNGGSVTGQTGSDADIYTNSSFVCANGTNRDIHGSVLAQGNVVFNDHCNVDGNVWAGGTVTGTKNNPTTLGGTVQAHNSGNAGYGISLMPNTQVGGPLTAVGGISWAGCSASPGTCTVADPGWPASKPFPIMRADTVALACWTATAPTAGCQVPGGFTLRTLTGTNCGNINSQIVIGAATWMSKSILVVPSPCVVDFSGADLAAKNDIAIFARAGIRAGNQTNVVNTGTGQRSVYWMVPYENGSAGCTSPSVVAQQRLSVSSTAQLLMYSRCTISISNNSDINGQIYSGNQLDASNSFDLQYRPLPVFGLDPSSSPMSSYRLDVIYKREQS